MSKHVMMTRGNGWYKGIYAPDKVCPSVADPAMGGQGKSWIRHWCPWQ